MLHSAHISISNSIPKKNFDLAGNQLFGCPASLRLAVQWQLPSALFNISLPLFKAVIVTIIEKIITK
jgi:hypothetical protein